MKAPGSGSFYLTDRIREAHRGTVTLPQSTKLVCDGGGQTVLLRWVNTGCLSTTAFHRNPGDWGGERERPQAASWRRTKEADIERATGQSVMEWMSFAWNYELMSEMEKGERGRSVNWEWGGVGVELATTMYWMNWAEKSLENPRDRNVLDTLDLGFAHDIHDT